VPIAEASDALREQFRLAAREVAPEDADDRTPLEQREVQRNSRNLARRESDDEEPPAPGQRPERRLGVGTAYGIVDDVDALARGQVGDAFAQVFVRVVDRRVGAVLAAGRELVLRRRAGD